MFRGACGAQFETRAADGAIMARRIAKEEGIFCGYSAGSCLQGMLQLKSQLKKDDVVVLIFHDHGSRYVGKIYNDQWMMERGFLDVKSFKDIVNGRTVQQKLVCNGGLYQIYCRKPL